MHKLSVVIITLNEERNIGRCLGSLKKITDDVIVVDSYSTDDTKSICEKRNVHFIQTDWKGYSETKNYANSQAKNDWILSLDADEALSEELQQSILDALMKDKMLPYRINRLTNYCGQWIKHGAWYPDYKLRIFNRHECKWAGHIHEQLSGVNEKHAEILKGDCYHYTYYTIDEHIKQTEKFSKMRAEEIHKEGKEISFVKMKTAPVFRFIRDYFFKGGFLDGRAGYQVARISAKAVYLKYYYLKKLQNSD